jgi:hypothetical protein
MNYQDHDYATDDHSTLPADPAPARSHANVDAGTYTARFARWHWDTSKKGDMCLAAMLRIVGGPFDGQQVRGTLYFDTDKADKNGRTAADRSMEALRSAGLAGELDAIDENTGGLDAGEVSISVEINDKGYAFAKYINAASTFSAFAPPPPDAKAQFFAQMKARQQGTAQAQRSTGAAPVQQRAGGVDFAARLKTHPNPPAQQSSGQQQRPAAQPAQGQQGQQRPASTALQQTPQGQWQRPRGPQVAPQQPMGFGADPGEDEIPF